MLKRIFHFILLAGMLASLFAAAPATPAHAAPLAVNTLADENDHSCADGDCSLRDALEVAAPGDTITFSVTGTITLSSYLDITKNLTITGPGPASLTLDGNNATRIFNVASNKTVAISGLTLTRGKPLADQLCGGAAIHTTGFLTLDDMVITNNDATLANDPMWCSYPRGGGIKVWQNGSLTVTNSIIRNNKSYWDGGGIYFESTNGTLSLTNVTISDNTVTSDIGGGLQLEKASGAVTLDRVTVSGNTAYSHSGGVLIDDANDNKVINITNSTIAGNSVNSGATQGGLYVAGDGSNDPTVNINNTTIAGNSGYSIYNSSGALINISNTILEDCSGTITSQGHNLIQNAAGCTIAGDTTGNITGQDPKLGVLANNGGFTKTMALLSGSPAINTGDNARCESTDQRGVTRPQGTHCEIGAYEVSLNAMLKSVGANDGSIVESAENSNTGGTLNNAATTINLGDDAANKQQRAILSFNTSNLPDNAVILKLTLKVKKNAIVGGGDPLNIFQGFKVDIKKGTFGAAALELGDFNAAAGKTYGPFSPTLSSDRYSINLTSAKGYVNKTGNTQIRLRFSLDDNNNSVANFLKLFSGNATATDRPQLVIQYYVP